MMTPGQQLAHQAAEAAEVRHWQTHPDVVALQVEHTRTLVDRVIWAGIVLGLLFTMTNVQQFTATTINAGPGSLGWWAAWLLDPTVALILLGVLVAERRVSPGQILIGSWASVAKWSLLAATYTMNTWESYATGNVAGIVLHSVPPLVVFMGAEAVTDCHHALTRYVAHAHTVATTQTPPTQTPTTPPSPVWAPIPTRPDPVGAHPTPVLRPVPTLGSPLANRVAPAPPSVPVTQTPSQDPPDRPQTPSQTPLDQQEQLTSLTDAELVTQVQRWADHEGSVPSRDRIRTRFGVGTKRADRTRAAVRTPRPRPAAVVAGGA